MAIISNYTAGSLSFPIRTAEDSVRPQRTVLRWTVHPFLEYLDIEHVLWARQRRHSGEQVGPGPCPVELMVSRRRHTMRKKHTNQSFRRPPGYEEDKARCCEAGDAGGGLTLSQDESSINNKNTATNWSPIKIG